MVNKVMTVHESFSSLLLVRKKTLPLKKEEGGRQRNKTKSNKIKPHKPIRLTHSKPLFCNTNVTRLPLLPLNSLK